MGDGIYTPQTQKGVFFNGLGWLLAILAVVGVLSAGVFGIRWLTAPAKGKLQAREQINSGSFRIAAYNHFFDLCAAAQTDGNRLVILKQELQSMSPTDDNYSIVRAQVAGVAADRADAINQYNVDASKGYTEGQFKASSLPYQLDINRSVTCVGG